MSYFCKKCTKLSTTSQFPNTPLLPTECNGNFGMGSNTIDSTGKVNILVRCDKYDLNEVAKNINEVLETQTKDRISPTDMKIKLLNPIRFYTILLMSVSLISACADVSPKTKSNIQSPSDLSGKHGLTLQWIDWSNWGEVDFTPIDSNTYSIKGSQVGNEQSSCPGCSISIEGTVFQVDGETLKFKGKIESVVSHINNGEPCIKEGEFDFISTNGKRYWRCQSMISCDSVVNYVDIYF